MKRGTTARRAASAAREGARLLAVTGKANPEALKMTGLVLLGLGGLYLFWSNLTRSVRQTAALAAGLIFRAPLDVMKVTSTFGYRTSPTTGLPLEYHNGVDLSAAMGTPVYSPEAGTVLNAWNDESGGGGLSVVIKHAGDWRTGFCHLSQFAVSAGQSVKKGQLIAYTGNTGGKTTGPHLHFRMVNGLTGEDVNPMEFV